MADVVDAVTRSRMMSGIRGKDTKPELLVRRGLHAKGLRYVLGGRGLPGRPDLVFPAKRTVIFVHGCFWHRHAGCKYSYVPKSRHDFWAEKFETNVQRDRVQSLQLRNLGWQVLTVWECELRKGPQATLNNLCIAIEGSHRSRHTQANRPAGPRS